MRDGWKREGDILFFKVGEELKMFKRDFFWNFARCFLDRKVLGCRTFYLLEDYLQIMTLRQFVGVCV